MKARLLKYTTAIAAAVLLAATIAPASNAATLAKISSPQIKSSSSSITLLWKKTGTFKTQVLSVFTTSSPITLCYTKKLPASASSVVVSRVSLKSCGKALTLTLTGTDNSGATVKAMTIKALSALPPAAASSVTVVSTTPTSATVSWAPDTKTAPASSYTIQLSNGAKQVVKASDPKVVTFTGLAKGSVVVATVTAQTPGVTVQSPTFITTPAPATVGDPPPTVNAATNKVTLWSVLQ